MKPNDVLKQNKTLQPWLSCLCLIRSVYPAVGDLFGPVRIVKVSLGRADFPLHLTRVMFRAYRRVSNVLSGFLKSNNEIGKLVLFGVQQQVSELQVFLLNRIHVDVFLLVCFSIRSFGVVLWELLTGEIPYKDVDSSAIIWGVGSNSLHLPVPSTCPDGFKILMKQTW